jgi:hypothetical protein
MGSDPVEDKADKTLVVSATTIGPIYQLPPEFDSDGGGEVGMVGNGEELLDKSIKEIQWETAEELTHAARLAGEAKREKRHNG